jgi:hypothetical protein
MKVLTMWQPYATLVIYKKKLLETRPNKTSWVKEPGLFEGNKGTYLIHAAQKWTKEQKELCKTEPFRSAFEELGYICVSGNICYWREDLPLGAIIGSVDVIECRTIFNDDFDVFYNDSKTPKINYIEMPELAFGDYRAGRSVWICENQKVLKTPMPYKNGQGYYQNFKGDESKLIFV